MTKLVLLPALALFLLPSCDPRSKDDDGGSTPVVTSTEGGGDELIGGIFSPAAGEKYRRDTVLQWMEDLRGEDRTAAFVALNRIGEYEQDASPAVPLIVQRLQSPESDQQMQNQALRALGRIGGEDARVALVAAMRDAERIQADLAADAIGLHGDDAVPSLVPFLTESDPVLRVRGARALWAVMHKEGREARLEGAVLPIARLLDDADPEASEWALRIMLELEGRAAPALDYLVQRLEQDKSVGNRRRLVLLIGLMGEHASGAADAMRAAIAPDDMMGQCVLGVSLARVGEVADGVARLERGLVEGENDIKVQAAGYLRMVGPPAASAVPKLRDALQGSNDDLRRMIEGALSAIEGDKKK